MTPPRPAGAARSVAALGAVLAGILLFFAPALAGAGQFLAGDTGRMHVAMKRWIAAELARGHLPEWNPFAGLGAPVTAGAIDAVLHPFNLLLVVLPFETGFRLWIVASHLLAATGGFLWARRLGCGPAAAAGGAAAFALSGFLVSSTGNLTFLTALATLPLLLAAGHAFAARPTPARLAGVALASFLAASAGDPQSWAIAVVLLPLQAALLAPGEDGTGPRRRALRGAVAGAVAVLAAAPAILPVAAWIPHSSRAAPLDPLELGRWNLHPLRLVELVVPHLVRGRPGALASEPYVAYAADPWTVLPWVGSVYLGVAALALAVLAARRGRPGRVLLAGAALFTWAALGPHAGFGQLAARLPVLGSFRYWEKLAVWPALLVAAAAALGIEALARDGRARRFAVAVAGVGALALAAAGALSVAPGLLDEALRPGGEPAHLLVANLRGGLLHAGAVALALAGVAALVVRGGAAAARAPALLALLLGVDAAAAAAGDWALQPSDLSRPRSPLGAWLSEAPGLQRVVTPSLDVRARFDGLDEYGSTFLWFVRTLHPTAHLEWGVGNFKSYLALIPDRAMELERRTPQARLLPEAALLGVGHAVIPGPPDAATAFGLGPPWRTEVQDAELGVALLALPARPRAYLAAELRTADRAGALAFALSEDPRSPRSVVEGPMPAGYAPPTGGARVVRDTPEAVDVAVGADRPALLVLNDVVAAGWRAEVDGRPAAILPANYLARGVWVPPGDHVVAFRYRTPLLREGAALAALALLLPVGWAAAGAVSRRRSRTSPAGTGASGS